MVDLSALGAGTAEIWTREAALDLLSPAAIRSLLYDGSWQSPLPGVYADGGGEIEPVQWGWAAVLATRPQGSRANDARCVVTCGRDAARIWELPLIDDDDPATGAQNRLHHDVTAPRHLRDLRSRTIAPDDPIHVLHRHQLGLAEQDLVRLPSGLWVTRRERTLLDLTPLVTHEALVCAIDHALQTKAVTLEDLAALAESRKGIAWAPAFRRAIELSDAKAESPAETLARLLLLPGLPGLRTQVPVLDERGRVIARLDLADEEIKLAVEPDGKRGHAGEAMVAKDRRRDAKTGPRGWWTERATWFELRRQQEQVRRRVVARADQRRRAA